MDKENGELTDLMKAKKIKRGNKARTKREDKDWYPSRSKRNRRHRERQTQKEKERTRELD